MSIISPAYEKRDTIYLLRLLQQLTSQGKKILVLDIGAHIGAFSVMMGNRFRDRQNLDIMAFEPDGQNYRLLKKNIACNHLSKKVAIHNVLLTSEDGEKLSLHIRRDMNNLTGEAPSAVTSQKNAGIHTLDSLLGDRIKSYDSIVMKIDTEGEETRILRGGTRLLESGADIHLLVEDFINPEIVPFLEQSGAAFVTKRTPYNSWWQL
jgi:FkbM family methyltransferase